MPLPDGAAEQITELFCEKHVSQAKIAQIVGISIPRVQRFLVAQGFYRPRPAVRTAERESQVMEAVQAYLDGEKVVEICTTYNINPAELYRELRARKVPYRTEKEDTHVQHVY